MIYTKIKYLQIIKDIVNKYPFKVYAFGSRVKGSHHDLSDLDLCIFGDVSTLTKNNINEDFENSELPFKVDIVEWNKIDDNFQTLIEDDFEEIT